MKLTSSTNVRRFLIEAKFAYNKYIYTKIYAFELTFGIIISCHYLDTLTLEYIFADSDKI